MYSLSHIYLKYSIVLFYNLLKTKKLSTIYFSRTYFLLLKKSNKKMFNMILITKCEKFVACSIRNR